MKLRLNKKNLAKMNAHQLKEYKKALARVREYYRDKKEWQNKLKSKKIPSHMSLQVYRSNKYGKFSTRSASQKELTEEAKNLLLSSEGLQLETESLDVLDKLKGMVRRLEAVRTIEKKILEEVKMLTNEV